MKPVMSKKILDWMSIRRTQKAVAIACIAAGSTGVLGTGCTNEVVDVGSGEEVGSTAKSFEEFKAGVYREPETGVYIVDGDTALESEKQLVEFFVRHQQGGALTVNQVNGADDHWNDAQKVNLTYCVSTAFGTNYNTVVQAMADASAAWQSVANVRFVYASNHDVNCSAGNDNVVFDVSPTSGQPYLARAFFPSYARANRNVLIDASSFGDISPYTLTGILRHELGHTLGFRHEHTRPEAGACFEDDGWRPLTTYDSASVMHYPQCNGSNRGDLVLTKKDQCGAALLYGGGGDTVLSPSRVWLSGAGNWTWANSKIVAGDFTGDGKADMVALYDYGNSNTGLWLFPSTGTGFASPYRVWLSGAGNWTWANSKIVAGDFTGDGKADLATLYNYGNSNTGLWLFPSTGTGFASPYRVWLSGAGNWTWANSEPVAGDFTGDGKADLAALYDYGNSNTGLWLFPSTGTGFASPYRVWLSGAGNWTWANSKPVAGDFTGDGKADLAALYDYGNSNTGLWLFPSTGTGIASLSRVWLSGAGNWTWANSLPVASDFTGDGKADLAAFYNYGNANTGLWLFPSTVSCL